MLEERGMGPAEGLEILRRVLQKGSKIMRRFSGSG